MPKYDYRCEPCKKTFEVEQSIKNVATESACPACGNFAARWYLGQLASLRIGGLTDTAYNRGYVNNSQFADDPETGEYMRKKAERAGVSIAGKVYRHALAEYPGDPEAWVSGIDDARDLCRRKGWQHKISDGVLDCKKDFELSDAAKEVVNSL